jgi:hypothetical protein
MRFGRSSYYEDPSGQRCGLDLLGTLDATHKAVPAQPGRADSYCGVADRARDAPDRKSALRLRGTLLCARGGTDYAGILRYPVPFRLSRAWSRIL